MTLRKLGPRRCFADVASRSKFIMESNRLSGGVRWLWWSLLICVPLVLALIELGRDLYCDTDLIRSVALRGKMHELRTQTIRRAGRLESLLEVNSTGNQGGGELDWKSVVQEPWLQNQWASLSAPAGQEFYLAAVSFNGVIVLHTDPTAVGKRLTSEWDDVKEPDAGNDVVRIRPGPLSGDRPALDVHVPLDANGQRIGRLHSGIDAAEFDRGVAFDQGQYLKNRSWLVALLLAANLGAVAGLALLVRDFRELRRQLAETVTGHGRLLAQLGMGLAHEIRNPLHALRLNVHTLRRSLGRAPVGDTHVAEIMSESSDEIDRLESLIRDFVQFTVPPSGDDVPIDLAEELQATLNLVNEELRSQKIELHTAAPREPFMVRMVPARIRQVLLTLLTFARKSAGAAGRIEVTLARNQSRAELIIADGGPPSRIRIKPGCSNRFSPRHTLRLTWDWLSFAA